MSTTGGSLVISTTTKLVGKFGGPGNTAGNSIPAVNRTVAGGTTSTTSFGAGTGYGDLPAVGEYIIAASASLTIDLYTGGVTTSDLVDVFGGSAPFRTVRGLTVEIVDAGADSTAGVRVGGAAANTWLAFFADASDKHDIFPDGVPYAGASPVGKAVGSATKNFKIENLSTTAARIVRVTANGSRFQAGEWVGGFWGLLTYP